MSQVTELTERLRACMREDSFASYDYQVPDSPEGIEDLAPYEEFDDYSDWESAAIVYALQDSPYPALSLETLTNIIGWTLHGLPDIMCTATFMQTLVCEGRIIVNENNTFSLLY